MASPSSEKMVRATIHSENPQWDFYSRSATPQYTGKTAHVRDMILMRLMKSSSLNVLHVITYYDNQY
jgi:hypothetical protein